MGRTTADRVRETIEVMGLGAIITKDELYACASTRDRAQVRHMIWRLLHSGIIEPVAGTAATYRYVSPIRHVDVRTVAAGWQRGGMVLNYRCEYCGTTCRYLRDFRAHVIACEQRPAEVMADVTGKVYTQCAPNNRRVIMRIYSQRKLWAVADKIVIDKDTGTFSSFVRVEIMVNSLPDINKKSTYTSATIEDWKEAVAAVRRTLSAVPQVQLARSAPAPRRRKDGKDRRGRSEGVVALVS